jgi:DNA adenine methylase
LLVRSFLKWPGGKLRLLWALEKILPPAECFVEPFVGAGSVFLNLDYPAYHLNDINQDLISLYTYLKTKPNKFIRESKAFFSGDYNHKEKYYHFRNRFNQSQDSYERALLFLYLNRHGYNGLCRYNQKGGYNVPFGSYVSPYFPEVELKHYVNKAKKVSLFQRDFSEIMYEAPKNSVIYCDPPYVPISKSANFTAYAGNSFDWEAHEKLAKCARDLSKRVSCVVISNHDLPAVRELYRGAKLIKLEVSRTLSCKTTNRNKVAELIAVFS